MSLFLAFKSHDEVRDLPLKVQDEDGFRDSTLEEFEGSLWDCHLDYKAFRQFVENGELKVSLKVEKVTEYTVDLSLSNLDFIGATPVLLYPDGDEGYHDAAHPTWKDGIVNSLTIYPKGGPNDQKIHAQIQYYIDDVLTGAREWTTASTDFLDQRNAAEEDLVEVLREGEFPILAAICPNFRSLLGANVIPQSDPRPPVIYVGALPPEDSLGTAGDYYTLLGDTQYWGPKGVSWGEPVIAPLPAMVRTAAGKVKSLRAQVHSGLFYQSDSRVLYFFDDPEVFGVWIPAFSGYGYTIREGDNRLGINPYDDSIGALPLCAVAFDLFALTSDDKLTDEFKTVFLPSSPTSVTLFDEPETTYVDLPWTDGDGYTQHATIRKRQKRYYYRFTYSLGVF